MESCSAPLKALLLSLYLVMVHGEEKMKGLDILFPTNSISLGFTYIISNARRYIDKAVPVVLEFAPVSLSPSSCAVYLS